MQCSERARSCGGRARPFVPRQSNRRLPHALSAPFYVATQVQAFYHELCVAQAGKARGASPDAVTSGGIAQPPRRNILSFGDSIHERAAIHTVTATMGPSVRTKSIKFVERPTVEQLKRQVDLVLSCFEDICAHNGCLDLMLTIQLLYQ